MAEYTGSHEMKPVRCGCGGEAWMSHGMSNGQNDCMIVCTGCGIATRYYNTEAEAVTAWNRAMGERTVKAEHVRLEEDVTFGNLTFRKGTGVLHKCTACGYWVKPGDKYCVNCGVRLEWE